MYIDRVVFPHNFTRYLFVSELLTAMSNDNHLEVNFNFDFNDSPPLDGSIADHVPLIPDTPQPRVVDAGPPDQYYVQDDNSGLLPDAGLHLHMDGATGSDLHQAMPNTFMPPVAPFGVYTQ